MRWLAVGALMLLVGLPALKGRADGKDEPKEAAKSKAAEEVDALITAHQKAVMEFYKDREEKLKNAKTDAERSAAIVPFTKAEATIDSLWDLVEKNPNDLEAAVKALRWLVTNAAYDEKNPKSRGRAWDMLIKDYAANPKIAPLMNDLAGLDYAYIPSPKMEEFLRAVLEKNPAREAKGKACLYLGDHLNHVVALVRRLKEQPAEANSMRGFLGIQETERLKEADPDKLAKEMEAVFEEANTKYGDVVLYTNPVTMKKTTVADRATGELFEIRHLAVGKEAPDIAAEDLDGKSLKLSDYRGKVVVIDFWGNW
ncbi:MAG TPA: hypothetical protein DDY78_23370 [Planctomycetales bacterium]|jgi:hypothetical protein|nr:hypothetical protein [Planctomycetales bacterium]